MRRGLLEMSLLIRIIFPSSMPETAHESCGIADLLTTCYSGRDWRCAKAFAKDPSRSWEDIEAELLKGQKLQGPSCCMDVQTLIDSRNLREDFPLLTAIHGAVTKRISPQDVFTTNGFQA
uniref:glycerol-3-phosphate dehydrogenase (NAD(+)) n=1 Tax=Spumella elongata TaxID=89044 RepID=A0A7S3HRT7_9STRA